MIDELSILMPCYNNECAPLAARLAAQAEAIIRQGRRLRYEIIVADDGSLIQKRYSDPSCQCYKVLLGKKMIGGYVLICQNDCGILDLLFLNPTLGNR